MFDAHKQRMKALALFSGGIDSPVAAKLMLERGMEVELLFFDNSPFSSDDTRGRALRGMMRMRELGASAGFALANGANQAAILKNCARKFTCLFCRRMMLRCAEAFAKERAASALVTGEMLGSKASQTSRNLGAVADAISLPLLRPLLGFDKEEVIALAREFGTFEISNAPAMCCTATPESPSTAARIAFLREEEKKFDAGALVSEALKTCERIF